jgi:hypothetical protein
MTAANNVVTVGVGVDASVVVAEVVDVDAVVD